MSSNTLPVCPKTGSTSPSLTVHLCLHTALLREIGNAPPASALPNYCVALGNFSHQHAARVPVWIMPLNRVYESFDPRTTGFDVVIIDEASQSDVTALAALYLARTHVVVGDKEQVTPDAIGQRADDVQRLIATDLQDIPNNHLYDGPNINLRPCRSLVWRYRGFTGTFSVCARHHPVQ